MRKKEGFTLVEILVVIMIIGMLSVLAIGGYTSYRRTALLDLNADAFVAQILEMKGNASRGNFDSIRGQEIRDSLGEDISTLKADPGDAKCFGLSFGKNADDQFDLKLLQWSFLDSKIYKTDRWDYVGCDDSEPVEKNFELDDMLKVETLSYLDKNLVENEVSGNVTLIFSPPEGAMKFLKDDEEIDDVNFLKVTMKYGDSNEARYTREILIDLKSLTATVNAI